MWVFIKQSVQLIFFGVSLYAGSFVISLLLGAGATHPVLGPTDALLSHVLNIILSAIGIAFSLQLASLTRMGTLKQTQSFRSDYSSI